MLRASGEAKKYTNPVVASRVVRGTIYDTDGRIIAIERPFYSCALLLKEVKDIAEVAAKLGPILALPPEEIVRESSQYNTYYLIKKRLKDGEVDQIRALKLKGVTLEKQYGRFYPQHYHASQVIGFTNSENEGLEGIELSLNDLLLPLPRLNEKITYGEDLYLTLDMSLQYLLDEQAVLIDRVHNPDEISAIIMDAKTGAILAMTNFPWYDPNEFTHSTPQVRQNRVITAQFEPGSVFKIFSLAALLESNQADFSEPFFCDGSYTYTTGSGQQVTVNCTEPHGYVDPQGMLKYSCNGAVAHWALQSDSNSFYDHLVDLGLTTKWPLELPGVAKGTLKGVDSWSGRSKATIAFGQEVAVSALQLATAATALTNDGDLLTPYIVKDDRHQRNVAQKGVISSATAQEVLKGMVQASEAGGTAVRSAVNGVKVASKTGTAQIINPQSGRYDEGAFLASTLSIFPADDPAYIIFIGVKNPKGATIWGANIAAPAIASIINSMVSQGKIISTVSEKVSL